MPCDRASSEVRSPHFGPGQVRAGQRGAAKFALVRLAWLRLALVSVALRRIAFVRFWPARFPPVRSLLGQIDSGQIVGLVAGRRVELGRRDPGCRIRPPHFGPGQVRAGQRGAMRSSHS